MCKQGTWCDALIVQAVANAYNLRINIVETADGFSEHTVVEAQHSSYDSRTSIVIGHVDEYHMYLLFLFVIVLLVKETMSMNV